MDESCSFFLSPIRILESLSKREVCSRKRERERKERGRKKREEGRIKRKKDKRRKKKRRKGEGKEEKNVIRGQGESMQLDN